MKSTKSKKYRVDDHLGKLLLLFILTTLVIVTLIFLSFSKLLSNFSQETVVDRFPNSEGTASLILVEVDEGALGGGVKVYLERDVFLGFTRKISVYTGRYGAQPQIEWMTTKEYIVNGKRGNI